MPNAKKTLVFFEGDDDKAFFEKLQNAGLLPESWELAKRNKDQHPGKDGLIAQLLPVVSPANGVGGHAVVFVDLDELTIEQRAEWFRKCISDEIQKKTPEVKVEDGPSHGRVRSFNLSAGEKTGRAALIGVGNPDDEELKSIYKVDRFAIDDWVFRLALRQDVFEAVSDLKDVSYSIAKAKYIEVADLFRKNGLMVHKSKTYIQILRTLADIRPSTATIVGRFIEKAVKTIGAEEFRKCLLPFFEDIEAASKALEGR